MSSPRPRRCASRASASQSPFHQNEFEKPLRLARVSLAGLGVDMARYGKRDYARTQEIGAALAFLGLDGLIAASARWDCDNLMIYQANHLLNERLDVIEQVDVDWQAWGLEHGFIENDGRGG